MPPEPTRRPADLLAAASAAKYGVFTIEDALACGLTREDVRRMLVQGWWRALHKGVYCAQLTPVTAVVREAAALAVVGETGVLSRFSAARHQQLDVADLLDDRVWVDVPYSRGRLSPLGVVVTRTRHPSTATLVDRLRCSPVARTLLDLAVHLDRGELARAVSGAVRSKATSIERVLSSCEQLGGRAGVSLMRSVCHEFDRSSSRCSRKRPDPCWSPRV